MSTLATAQLESDDEGDLDFVPDERPKKKRRPNKSSAPGTSATHDDNSDSGSSSSSHSASSARSTQSSRVRRSKESREADEEAERSRRAADAFALMRAEASGSRAQDQPKGAELPETGADPVDKGAIKTVSEKPALGTNPPTTIFSSNGKDSTTALSVASPSPPPATEPKVNTSTSSSTRTTTKPPPRRKPRQSLEQMSAALDKGKKMTTFAKSQLDWKNHTASDTSMQDELEANRRSGGFLEKRDFLERVDERRTDAFDKRKER